MKITITGPRSVGKTTVSKLVAKKLALNYVSSDEIGEKATKKMGGLDKAIKSGLIKKFIKKGAYSLIRKEYKKDNFVFDLSGGSISSQNFPEASEKVRNIAKSESIVVGLLPSNNFISSVILLYKREIKREHFKDSNKIFRIWRTFRHYSRFPNILREWVDFVIYTKGKKPEEIADEIIKKIKS